MDLERYNIKVILAKILRMLEKSSCFFSRQTASCFLDVIQNYVASFAIHLETLHRGMKAECLFGHDINKLSLRGAASLRVIRKHRA